MRRLGILGARGHVGGELVRLVAAHPGLELAFVGSRALAGAAVPGTALCYSDIAADDIVPSGVDALVLALPNGAAAPYVAAVGDAPLAVVDLSADYRFDDAWRYGLVELGRERLRGARRIANPGCYATAAQLALAPLVEELGAEPRIFGVSGYSGAGTTPSPRNDPERLRDNLMPYALIDHTHEREIGRHLGHPVRFMPHVASFFRGIGLTIDCQLRRAIGVDELRARFRERYSGEPLIEISDEAPLVRDNAGEHGVRIGGFEAAGTRAVLVATIDNLLKGAATQALQNVNLALGFEELAGIR